MINSNLQVNRDSLNLSRRLESWDFLCLSSKERRNVLRTETKSLASSMLLLSTLKWIKMLCVQSEFKVSLSWWQNEDLKVLKRTELIFNHDWNRCYFIYLEMLYKIHLSLAYMV